MHALATSSARLGGYLWDVVSNERESKERKGKVREARVRRRRKDEREKYLAKRSWMYYAPSRSSDGPVGRCKQAAWLTNQHGIVTSIRGGALLPRIHVMTSVQIIIRAFRSLPFHYHRMISPRTLPPVQEPQRVSCYWEPASCYLGKLRSLTQHTLSPTEKLQKLHQLHFLPLTETIQNSGIHFSRSLHPLRRRQQVRNCRWGR